jgi:hypothetical protein
MSFSLRVAGAILGVMGVWIAAVAASEQIDCPPTIRLDGFGGDCRVAGLEAIQGWELREAPSDPLFGRKQCPPESPNLVDGLVQAGSGLGQSELACEYEGARGHFMVARPVPMGRTCRVDAQLLSHPKRIAFQCD